MTSFSGGLEFQVRCQTRTALQESSSQSACSQILPHKAILIPNTPAVMIRDLAYCVILIRSDYNKQLITAKSTRKCIPKGSHERTGLEMKGPGSCFISLPLALKIFNQLLCYAQIPGQHMLCPSVNSWHDAVHNTTLIRQNRSPENWHCGKT